jgi:outer membrane cobalamin receptor
VNVSARYAASEKLEFFGRVENATDTNYEVVSNYNTPGLSFYGGMRVQF